MTHFLARGVLGSLLAFLAMTAGCGSAATVSTADGGDRPDAVALDGGATDDDAASSEDAAVSGDDASISDEDASTSDEDAAVVDAAVSDEDASTVDDAATNADAGLTPSGCAMCLRSEYCELETGSCRGDGTCSPRPDICPDIYLPVCGCDGRTYSNACDAASNGQSIRAEGECPTGDCREEGCPGRAECVPCRGAGYVCLPPGTAC